MTRTIGEALSDATLHGFEHHVYTHDSGQTIEVVRWPGTPRLRTSYEWGDEADAVKDIDQHVARWRPLSEDDPTIQHEGVYL